MSMMTVARNILVAAGIALSAYGGFQLGLHRNGEQVPASYSQPFTPVEHEVDSPEPAVRTVIVERGKAQPGQVLGTRRHAPLMV
jgi:hypothetical protein